MALLWCGAVMVLLVHSQITGGQVCDWDWELDPAQGLDPGSLDAGARYLSVLREVRDMEHCLKACCAEPACQLAQMGAPADGPPQCMLVSCLRDGRDACLLQPSTQFKVYRKRSQEETAPPPLDQARSTSQEENATNAELCRRPVKVGSCRAAFPRFFYDAGNQSCRSFTYGGCGDNGNNFQSVQACEEACLPGPAAEPAPRSRSLFPPSPVPHSPDVSLPEISADDFAERCGSVAEVGPCRAAMTRWFYNSNTHSCQSFIYGGCRGNKNNYASQENCMAACTVTVLPSTSEALQTKELEESCLVAPEAGPCRAAFTRFYFQPAAGRCQPFIYGGCQGNNNRYETVEDCMFRCEGLGQLNAPGPLGKRDRSTPAFFLVGVLAVVSVLVLSALVLIALHRSRGARRGPPVSDKEELLPPQGELSSLESLSVPQV